MKTVAVPVEPTTEMIEAGIRAAGKGYRESYNLSEFTCEDVWQAMLAAGQQEYTGFDRTASHNAGEYREFQREANSNPSPVHGQSKQGLTASHAGAPTTIKGWAISEAEQKLLDEYAACFDEPTDAPTHQRTEAVQELPASPPQVAINDLNAATARIAELEAELKRLREPMPEQVYNDLIDEWLDKDPKWVDLVRRVEAWHANK